MKLLPKLAAATVALVASVLLVAGCEHPTSTPSPSGTTTPLDPALTAAVDAAVNVENTVLVAGDLAPSYKNGREFETLRTGIQARIDVAMSVRSALAQDGIRYTSFETRMTIENFHVDGDIVTIEATEHTIMQMDGPAGAPPYTEYAEPRTFTFRRVADTWTLMHTAIIPPPPETSSKLYYPSAPAPPQEAPQASKQPSIALAYSPAAAVNYALAYACDGCYNSDYRLQVNDCADFASQALRAGGWRLDQGLGNVWYYNGYYFYSDSWTVSKKLYEYMPKRAHRVSRVEAIPGDIVQMDWDNNICDGIMDHTAIVTAQTGTGILFLSQHSPSRKNKPLAAYMAERVGTYVYWHIDRAG